MSGYDLIRPLIFRLDAEQAHGITLSLLRVAGALPPVRALIRTLFAGPPDPVTLFGLTFPNRVGLAAGYDKDGIALRGLATLGFGHIEVGTVTLRPQPGNPRPRIFRLPEDRAVINRMGFPSRGADFVAHRLQTSRPDGIVGVNIGKNKETPLENAVEDYLALMHRFAPLADYLTINISSPNTVGLRRLQGRAMLESLLGALSAARPPQTPILVKLAPDLRDDELDDALEAILRSGMDGVIITNTTVARPEGLGSPHAAESGGLSGAPLRPLSEAMLAKVVARLEGRLPVISVGGIMTPEDARRRLEMGAALVQLYTGLIYAGPGLVRACIQATKGSLQP